MRTNKLIAWISLTSFISLAISCGKAPNPTQEDSDLLRIIDENDLTPIDESYASYNIVKAIGRMELGCTVTHIGNGLAVTAGHCIADRPFEGKKTYANCRQDKHAIHWGVTYNSEGYMKSECLQIIVSEYNLEKDYAVIRVYPEPKGVVAIDNQGAEIGEDITILSHPQKRPLEWSGWCTIEGTFPKSDGHQFGYSCDTQGGSSGAAVLNEDLRMIGIHNFYNGEYNRNGATHIESTPIASLL